MISGQQPIILGRGFSTHWQQNAPKVGARVNAVVVEMEGSRGILEVEGHLMRIETQLPLQEGQVIPLLFLGKQDGRLQMQLLTGEASRDSSTAVPGADSAAQPANVQQTIVQGLLAFRLPAQGQHVQTLQRILPPTVQDPSFFPRLAAGLSLLQSGLPVTEQAVRALLQAQHRHEQPFLAPPTAVMTLAAEDAQWFSRPVPQPGQYSGSPAAGPGSASTQPANGGAAIAGQQNSVAAEPAPMPLLSSGETLGNKPFPGWPQVLPVRLPLTATQENHSSRLVFTLPYAARTAEAQGNQLWQPPTIPFLFSGTSQTLLQPPTPISLIQPLGGTAWDLIGNRQTITTAENLTFFASIARALPPLVQALLAHSTAAVPSEQASQPTSPAPPATIAVTSDAAAGQQISESITGHVPHSTVNWASLRWTIGPVDAGNSLALSETNAGAMRFSPPESSSQPLWTSLFALQMRPTEMQAASVWQARPPVPLIFAGTSQILVNPMPSLEVPQIRPLFGGPWDLSSQEARSEPQTQLNGAPFPNRQGDSGAANPGSGQRPLGLLPLPGTTLSFHAELSPLLRTLSPLLHIEPSPSPFTREDISLGASAQTVTDTETEEVVQTNWGVVHPASLTSPQAGLSLARVVTGQEEISIFQLLQGSTLKEDGVSPPPTAMLAEVVQWLGEERLQALVQQRLDTQGVWQLALPMQWNQEIRTVYLRVQQEKEQAEKAKKGIPSGMRAEILAPFNQQWLWIHADLRSTQVSLDFVSLDTSLLAEVDRERSILQEALAKHQLTVDQWQTIREDPLHRWRAGQPDKDVVDTIRRTPIPSLDLKA